MNRRILTFTISITACVALSGCAKQWYSFDGQRYKSPDTALSKMDETYQGTVSNIKPLPKPLTTKKLVIAIPSQEAITNGIRDLNKKAGIPITAASLIYLAKTDARNNQFLVDSIRQKNIYSGVETVETQLNPSLQPSADSDVLFSFASLDHRGTQWYLVSQRNGKQVLTHDVSLPTLLQRTESQLDFIKAFALQ